MKKIGAWLLAVAMVLSLAACGGETQPTGSAEEESGTLQVDENLLTVEITLPADFVEGTDPAEIQANGEEQGFQETVIHDDGSVTYTMSKAKHKELLADLKAGVDQSIDEMLNGEEAVEAFQKIEYSKDLTAFDIYVDQDLYSGAEVFSVLGLYLVSMYYQAFAGVDVDTMDVTVRILDHETNEVIEDMSAREMMDAEEDTADED